MFCAGSQEHFVKPAVALQQVHEVRYDKQSNFQSVAKVMDLKVQSQ